MSPRVATIFDQNPARIQHVAHRRKNSINPFCRPSLASICWLGWWPSISGIICRFKLWEVARPGILRRGLSCGWGV